MNSGANEMAAASIDQCREGLDPDTRAMIDALRDAVLRSHVGLVERLKWNAPSFLIGGEDRITLGIERKGGARVVLHRGARPRDVEGFRFDDPDRLARWPSPDRGVIVFADLAAIEIARAAVSDLCRRWIEHTA